MKPALQTGLASALILSGLAIGWATPAAMAQEATAQHDRFGHSMTMTSASSMMGDMREMMDACAAMMKNADKSHDGDGSTSAIGNMPPTTLATIVPRLREQTRLSVIDAFWMW